MVVLLNATQSNRQSGRAEEVKRLKFKFEMKKFQSTEFEQVTLSFLKNVDSVETIFEILNSC